MSRQIINFGHLNVKKTLFMLCDVQEAFRPGMKLFDAMITNTQKLLAAGKALDIPLIATEHYPQKLGPITPKLDIQHANSVFAKTLFSMITPEVHSKIDEIGKKKSSLDHIVIFGLEAHICLEQSAMDLRSLGYDVHVVADCSMARSLEDRHLAFERMRQIGCFVTTSESVIFKLMKDKNHESFNTVRKFVMNTSVETGLAGNGVAGKL